MEQFCERIHLLKVPLDILEESKLEEVVFGLIKSGGGKNIVLLSLSDLMKARFNTEYAEYVKNAALVLPISKSIISGAKFLTGKTPVRVMPFNFIVKLLTILENREYTVYLLGGRPKVLEKTEKHIRSTFPKLRVIGRFPATFKKQNEEVLLQVIRKSSPALLLVNAGVHGGERWLAVNSARLGGGLRLWCSDLFDVFSERKKRVSSFVFDKGLEWLVYFFRSPLRIFRIFVYLYYKILLLVYKLKPPE